MNEKHQHICPRNCYDTCSMVSITRNDILLSVEGNPDHPYTQSKLCSKALDDVHKVYHPQRIRYPMRQRVRYSGHWERITWDEALETIARRILLIQQQYGTTLPLALNKYSGNFGTLHTALEGLLAGIGDTTRAVGSPCWSAGVDAQMYDFGKFFCSDPLDMAEAKLIWLWGVNPAWTAVHQMPIIFKAMDRGAKVVCFDTHFSETAARSTQFVAVRPGTDGLLALAMAKVLVEEKLIDPNLAGYTLGHENFITYLNSEIDLAQAAEQTGVDQAVIRELAREYGEIHPACIWAGFGLQRYTNGGQTLRALDALGVLAGHVGEVGGGVQYGQFETWRFSGSLQNSQPVKNVADGTSNPRKNCSTDQGDRLLNINRFASEALACTDPPIKMLWLASRNPLSQDGDLHLWHSLIKQLDLLVVSDLFFTKSSEAADIFLPVTTHYEHWDLNASYWHYWIGVNEPAIPPVGEARSDLQIAWNVSERLNKIEPGRCGFPTQGSEKETLLRELGPEMLGILGLNKPEEILKHPVRASFPSTAWADRQFATPSGKYEFFSAQAKQAGFPALPEYTPPTAPSVEFPFRLLTPHHYSTINSQVYQPDEERNHYVLHLNSGLAESYCLKEGERAEIWNDLGRIEVLCQLEVGIPGDVLVIYQEAVTLKNTRLNSLIKSQTTDMGLQATGAPGFAINETFVNLCKLPSG